MIAPHVSITAANVSPEGLRLQCRKTHITLLSTAPAQWTPGSLRALWRSTAVAAAVRLFCAVPSSSWRRPCRMSCGHRGMERMVYCMAGTRLLETQMRDILYNFTVVLKRIWHLRQRALLTLLTSAERRCQQALPSQGRATERTLRLAASMSHDGVNTMTEGLLAAVAPPAAGHHNADPQQPPRLCEISSNCSPLLR